MKRRFRTRKVTGILAMVVIGLLAFGTLVMLLWNALMPPIFNLHPIGFWQALGILALAKILFGGFRGGPGLRWRMDSAKQGWTNMTPEQREKFRQEWSRRCRKPFPTDRFDSGESAKDPATTT
jgi:hypothetical protein